MTVRLLSSSLWVLTIAMLCVACGEEEEEFNDVEAPEPPAKDPENYTPLCDQGEVHTGDIVVRNASDAAALESVNEVDGNLIFEDYAESSMANIGCVQVVKGDIVVRGTTLVTFAGLEKLQVVHGSVTFEDNPALVAAPELFALSVVGGDVVFRKNPALIDMAGLDYMSEIYGALILEDNDAITEIRAPVRMLKTGGLQVRDNDALEQIVGLTARATYGDLEVGGLIAIENNPSLSHISLPAIAEGPSHLVITDAPALDTVSFDSELRDTFALEGDFYLHVTGLVDLDGFSKLSAVSGDIWLEGNGKLADVQGLSNIAPTIGGLWVADMPSLVSLTGLDHVTHIDDTLSITEMSDLWAADLYGLEQVGHAVYVLNNDVLQSVNLMSNFTSFGAGGAQAGDFKIMSNESLPDCDPEFLVQRLAESGFDPDGAEIADNGEACSAP